MTSMNGTTTTTIKNKSSGIMNPYLVASTDRIAIIGAGVAGIATAAALQNAGYSNFVVYEKQPNLGGLWMQNYPNVAGMFDHFLIVALFVCVCVYAVLLVYLFV
jgi:heterodisulfide reductase subunit A-like polyferredoxin